MKKRMLRDIEVSEIGMGCMAFSHGYGQIPNESYSIEAIRNAFRHGCTFFDTAEGTVRVSAVSATMNALLGKH